MNGVLKWKLDKICLAFVFSYWNFLILYVSIGTNEIPVICIHPDKELMVSKKDGADHVDQPPFTYPGLNIQEC